MKYIAEYIVDDVVYEVEFPFYGNTNRNKFRKAAREVFWDMGKRHLVASDATARVEMDLPNIWTNGAVGCLYLIVNNKYIYICLRQKGCDCYIAC